MDHIDMPVLSHAEFRPIFDFGDHCVVSSFNDAKYYGVYTALIGEPASRDEIFDDPGEALKYMLRDTKFGGVKTWYNGNETMLEVRSEEDVFEILAEFAGSEKELESLAKRLSLDPDVQDRLVTRFASYL